MSNVFVAVQKFDSTMRGWRFTALSLTAVGEMVWSYGMQVEDGVPLRPDGIGLLKFPGVSVILSGRFQVLAIPPGSNVVRFQPSALIAPFTKGSIYYNLVPSEGDGQIQRNDTTGTSKAQAVRSRTRTGGGELSAELAGAGGKSSWSDADTETDPSQTDTTGSGTTLVTPTKVVMSLSLERTMHLKEIASLAPSKLLVFG